MKLLSRQDPILDQILYYEDVPLFEDELHDNGESSFNVRIRVMPHSFFLLARLFLRVDNVVFRLFDVRIYHAFNSSEVIREVTGMEADYNEVKAKLERPSDLSPLTSSQFVHDVMTVSGPSAMSTPNTSRGKPWPGLGKRTEVLKLPGPPIEDGIASLSVS